VKDVAHFAFDYTFFLNLVAVAAAGFMYAMHRLHLRHKREGRGGHHETMETIAAGGLDPHSIVAYVFIAVLCGGIVASFLAG
jgi:hypothetical protein